MVAVCQRVIRRHQMLELLRYFSVGQGRVNLVWKRRFAAGAGKVPQVELTVSLAR